MILNSLVTMYGAILFMLKNFLGQQIEVGAVITYFTAQSSSMRQMLAVVEDITDENKLKVKGINIYELDNPNAFQRATRKTIHSHMKVVVIHPAHITKQMKGALSIPV